jgi:hypothetical protein
MLPASFNQITVKNMIDNYDIATVFTVILFVFPLLYFIISQKSFYQFSIQKLTKSFNYAFVAQMAIAIIIILLMKLIDNEIYGYEKGNDLTDIFMSTGITYTIIGAFIYIPGLIILNIITFIIMYLKKTRVK